MLNESILAVPSIKTKQQIIVWYDGCIHPVHSIDFLLSIYIL